MAVSCQVLLQHHVTIKVIQTIHIHLIKSSDVIGRAQYTGNGNHPLLPI